MGDWTFYVRYPEAIKTVTPEQIQQAVQTYFVEDKSTTGYFIPRTAGAETQATTASSSRSPEELEQMLYYRDHDFEPAGSGHIDSPVLESKQAADTDLASKIKKTQMGDIELYTMKTGVHDVVTITGSLAAGAWFSPSSNSMIADMTGNMLDQGTMSKDKFEIAEELENLGASISFSVGANTLTFNAKALKKDVPTVMALLAEQLREPAFDHQELEKLKIQRKGALQRSLENTGYMASSKLSQILYPENHPNYQTPVEDLITDIENVTVEDLKSYHKAYYGPKSLKIVAVGDVDENVLECEVKNAFSGWTGGMDYKQAISKAVSTGKIDEIVFMEDKTSVSVNMGIPIGIDEQHPDYLPLMLGTYVLGGNFSARLMSTVRDKEGLTYGIGSSISGATLNDGHWSLSATFAPNLLDQGMKSTMREVQNWVESGISAEELDAKKSTISGLSKVQLATTGGLASYIHDIALRGKPVSYADQFFEDIQALTLDQVNGAIKKYIDLDKLVVVKAGTVEMPTSR